jgi:hypothetical protein
VAVAQGELGPPGRLGDAFKTLGKMFRKSFVGRHMLRQMRVRGMLGLVKGILPCKLYYM